MKSLWRQGVKMPSFPTFKGKKRADVLIIGGGLCGLTCAYLLKQKGVDSIVLEADRIGGGTTGNTTGKITLLHGLIYHQLLQKEGREPAQMYLQANLAALEQYKRLAQNIDCDFEEKSAYTYSLDDPAAMECEAAALQALGMQAHFSPCPDLPFDPVGAVRVDGQAQFHPLKFLAQIAKDLCVYEHSPVRDVAPYRVTLDEGVITAKRIIVATHFPILNKHGSYFLKLYQHRSYVLALENAPAVSGMYVDAASGGLSFRDYGNLLLLGGGGHRTGKRGGGWQDLARFAARYYPHAHVRYRWAAQDCMSLDGISYVGLYSKKTPNLYVASGFNKWGMTGSMAAAMTLCDLVTDTPNNFAKLFDPCRSIIKPQLFVNSAETALHLLRPTAPRCTHLGCALSWNKAEHSWDCACHGSRFSSDGKLLEPPATRDLKK